MRHNTEQRTGHLHVWVMSCRNKSFLLNSNGLPWKCSWKKIILFLTKWMNDFCFWCLKLLKKIIGCTISLLAGVCGCEFSVKYYFFVIYYCKIAQTKLKPDWNWSTPPIRLNLRLILISWCLATKFDYNNWLGNMVLLTQKLDFSLSRFRSTNDHNHS